MTSGLSVRTKFLWAKKGKPGEMTWLPLYQHMADTAKTAARLWQHRLSSRVKHLLCKGLNAPEDEALMLLMFLAAAHDLGKATPVFQSKPRSFPMDDLDDQLLDGLRASGLPCDYYDSFPERGKTTHALTCQLLLEHFGCNQDIAAVLGAHHGKPADSTDLQRYALAQYRRNYHMGSQGWEAWRDVQRELLDFALRIAGYESVQDLPQLNFDIQLILTGLVIMADWIASNEYHFPYFPYEDDFVPLKDDNRAEDAWFQLNLPTVSCQDALFAEPDYYFDRFQIATPYPAQEAALHIAQRISDPGIFILEAPMGTGKTEAALVTAEIFAQKTQQSGVLFALPTQATSNAIFPRLLAWTRALEFSDSYVIRLAHGKAQFNEEYRTLLEGSRGIGESAGDAIVHQWFEGRKKSLLADFVVGTIDQFLLSALKQKHMMLRHLGLAGKVLVLDECHAYDAYMNKYLDTALAWMGAYGVPVIILSATLPAHRRTELVNAYLRRPSRPKAQRRHPGQSVPPPEPPPAWTTNRAYPLITWTDGETVCQEAVQDSSASWQVALERLEESDLVSRLKPLLAEGGYVGVMLNTVQRAQKYAQALKDAFGETHVTLTHAAFIAPDRAAKEEKLLRMLGKPRDDSPRTGTHIVVGTQVIEQSLDLDFDILVSDLCPMDLLLQRMGRLHRHKRARPAALMQARCFVFGALDEDFESGAKAIYKAYPLMRTKAFLPDASLSLPDDIPRLIQDVYDSSLPLPDPPKGYAAAKEAWDNHITRQEGSAASYCIKRPQQAGSLIDFMAKVASDTAGEAAVRDGGDSVEVLVIHRLEEGLFAPLHWKDSPQIQRGISPSSVPDSQTARMLAQQSLRLPYSLSHEGIIDQTIRDLEASNQPLTKWQESPWLKGMLFLILDKDHKTTLCGYRLAYHRDMGLLCEKEKERT